MWSNADIEILTEAMHLAREHGTRPSFFYRAYSDESFLVDTYCTSNPLMVDTFARKVWVASMDEYDKYHPSVTGKVKWEF
jgi:hypothetical protein